MYRSQELILHITNLEKLLKLKLKDVQNLKNEIKTHQAELIELVKQERLAAKRPPEQKPKVALKASFSSNHKSQIKKLRVKGFCYREIANRLGVSTTAVYKYCKSNNILKNNKPSTRWAAYLHRDKINEMHARGYRVSEIAKIVGIKYTSVYNYLRN